MRPNAKQLAMRDPAAAVLLGAIAGADFGVESSPFGHEFGSDFGADFGDDFGSTFSPMGADFGDDWGADFGDDFGAAAAAGAIVKPSPQQMAGMYVAAVKKRAKTAQRKNLLEPNAGSAAKVERYSFAISQAITIGTGVAINITGSPDVDIRPQRVVCNVPTPAFVFLSLIKVANVTVTVGPGVEDAMDYSALAVGTMLDLPTLTPANRATVQGTYTGFIPPGYVNGTSSFFVTSMKGWASIVA